MNILIIAPFEGWVKTYLTQLGNGLCRIGNHVEYINYRLLDKSLFSFLKNDDAISLLRNRNLEKLLKKSKPDAVLFVIARMNFDFEMIRIMSLVRVQLCHILIMMNYLESSNLLKALSCKRTLDPYCKKTH